MGNKFKVYEHEIPVEITVYLGMTERALFTRMLTAYKINVEDAGDTFEHIIREGIKKFYNDRFSEDT